MSMTMPKLQHWDATVFGELTLEAVKARHQPAYKYRVNQRHYPPHTPFKGAAVDRTLYVTSGSCTITLGSGGESYSIGAGQFVELPQGEYTMAYPESVEVISALHLSTEAASANLIGAALHSADLGSTVEICLQAAHSPEVIVRGNAILAFGHLARRFGQLDRLRVEPLVLAALNDSNEYVRGQANAAADDIQQFLGWKIRSD